MDGNHNLPGLVPGYHSAHVTVPVVTGLWSMDQWNTQFYCYQSVSHLKRPRIGR